MFFENNVKKYFDFLVSEYGFSNPIFYNVAHELHATYIKDDWFINIAFDGCYWCTIHKSRQEIQNVLSGKIKINDMDYRKIKNYDISKLDKNKKVYNAISFNNISEKELLYYSTLLKNNPKILNGDF